MFIPAKYVVKENETPATGSLMLKCSVCGKEFAIPPQEITADLAAATVCDDPACVEAANKTAAATATAEMKSNVDTEHTGTLK